MPATFCTTGWTDQWYTLDEEQDAQPKYVYMAMTIGHSVPCNVSKLDRMLNVFEGQMNEAFYCLKCTSLDHLPSVGNQYSHAQKKA